MESLNILNAMFANVASKDQLQYKKLMTNKMVKDNDYDDDDDVDDDDDDTTDDGDNGNICTCMYVCMYVCIWPFI